MIVFVWTEIKICVNNRLRVDGALVTHRPIHKYVPCSHAVPLYSAQSNIGAWLLALGQQRSEASDKKWEKKRKRGLGTTQPQIYQGWTDFSFPSTYRYAGVHWHCVNNGTKHSSTQANKTTLAGSGQVTGGGWAWAAIRCYFTLRQCCTFVNSVNQAAA